MRRILLINPVGMTPAIPPLGLEYLAESLIASGYAVRLLDLSLQADPDRRVIHALASQRWDAIGITVRNIDDILVHAQQYFLPRVRRLVAMIKRISPVSVILGGAGFSIQPREILQEVGADYGVAGCGVPATQGLLRGLWCGDVQPGTVMQQDPEEYLPQVYQRTESDLRAYSERGVAVGVHTLGGCTMDCIYCTYPQISGYRVKTRDPHKVVAEVENLVEQGIREIFFADSVFNIAVGHAVCICQLIAERGLPVTWHSFFNPRAKLFTEELLDAMVDSGVRTVQLGVDSGSERILEIFRKGFTRDDIVRATRMCQRRGVPVSHSVMFGAPGETIQSVDETFELIDVLRPDYVDVELGVRIYKPTELARIAEEEALVAPDDDLCEPTFYPFPHRAYVWEQVSRRDNCHICHTEQPVYRGTEDAAGERGP